MAPRRGGWHSGAAAAEYKQFDNGVDSGHCRGFDVEHDSSVDPSTTGPPAATPNPDNDHLFTIGDIEVPQGGEAGEVSVVVGNVVDPGHLMLIVRNNRDVPVYEINITLTGTDSYGKDVTLNSSSRLPELEPGEWIFGSNGIETAGMNELADVQFQFDTSEQPGHSLLWR